MNSKPRPRVTLSELLTSTAIVAVLAAILLPALSVVQQRDNASTCLTNLSRLGRALRTYAQDYDETMPAALASIPAINGGTVSNIPYDMQIRPYMDWGRGFARQASFFVCPSDTLPRSSFTDYWDGSLKRLRLRRSYVYATNINTQARANAGGSQPDPNTGMSVWGSGYTLSSMDSPGETIALTEGWASNGGVSDAVVGSPWSSILSGCDTWKLPGRNVPAQNPDDQFAICGEYSDFNRQPLLGHNRVGNYALADGHAAPFTWQQVRANDFRLFKLRK